MIKYPKIKYPNNKASDGVFETGYITIQEKLDGGNFRFTHERNLDEEYQTSQRNIVFGSRNVIYKNMRDERKQFAGPMDFIRETVNPRDILDLERRHGGAMTFFGEAMTPHTLEYDRENTPLFIGFDVYHEDDERFLSRQEIERSYDILGLPTTPVIDVVSAANWSDYSVEVTDSAFGDVEAEGLVFKNYETQTFSKFVREDFKEKAKKTFGKSKKQQTTDAERLSYQYITNARIKKQAHKMVDEGEYDSLKMEMMGPTENSPGLPERVIRDMAEEEAANVLMNENWEVDISDFRSTTSSRCAAVLKKMIQEHSMGQLS